ncbi:hypothetical protein F53441_5949 [Fusarium austroafricanum]|uniref:F-box domain-containing protein n=1 Tax=Fusarium austroafricanum TaxID=2364996 RepID=A0A8H4KIK2_9HYPO|nr:hypothetical protein F53441_5949 [Fusarium austroafricanum]
MTSFDQNRKLSGSFGYLPVEILKEVVSFLPNLDIKSLRQTCSYMKEVAHLRLDRVFLSTNPLDIEVFKAIADHDVFQLKVKEIIYDDARHSSRYPTFHDVYMEGDEGDIGDVTGVPDWFRMVYSEHTFVNYMEPEDFGLEEVDFATIPRCTPIESYQLYEKMYKQQRDVIASNRDAEALKYGLTRFSNLKKVTLTPAAYGLQKRPLYHTPNIRSIPEGLVCPKPQGWPESPHYYLGPWDGLSAGDFGYPVKQEWRGFSLVTKHIAEHLRETPTSNLTEFGVDSHQLWLGVNCRVFDKPNHEEYQDLVTILSHPGFKSLTLSLSCGGQARENWVSFRSGCLHDALSKAPDLQCISLYTSIPVGGSSFLGIGPTEHNYIPLRTIFPVNKWLKLRHFSLSRFFVKRNDVIEFLFALPSTLESLELSHLVFIPVDGNYRDLLQGMRAKLGWRERPARDQPKLIVLVENREASRRGLVTDVSQDVMDFVYRDGPNPFSGNSEERLAPGKGVPWEVFGPIQYGYW